MLAARNPYIKSAYEQLQIISQDKEKRLEYEAREKAVRDHNQLLYEAEERGVEKGIELGREEGIELGREEGIELGMEKGREEGREEGIELGMEKGREEGIEFGMKASIRMLLKMNLQEGDIIEQLQEQFSITKEQAEKMLKNVE